MAKRPKLSVEEKIAAASAAANARVAAGENPFPKATRPAKPSASSNLVCPHCNTQGQVTVTTSRAKRGVSGGKATGAVLTGGVSLVLTGLSRRQTVRQLSCGNCKMKWTVE